VTAMKIDSKPSMQASEALAPHASPLFASLGSSRLAVVELRSVERAEPAPDEDKETAVKVRIVGLEVANADQEETLRRAMQALHLHRTAYGTITEDGDLEMAKSTLALIGDELHAYEAARLRSLIEVWTNYGRQALFSSKLTEAEVRSEMKKVFDVLRGAIHGERAEVA